MAECDDSGVDSVFQVIDHITVNAALSERYPESLPEGLWVILTPEETQTTAAPTPGRIVHLEKPDGSTTQVTLDCAAIRHGVMALRFCGLNKDDIPRLTRVSW
jgi:hypothetical protein